MNDDSKKALEPAAFDISNTRNTIFHDVKIQNTSVGIRASNSDFVASEVHGHNVEKLFDVDGGTARVDHTSLSESPEFMTSTKRRRPKEGMLPAKCKDCESIFASTRYSVMNARFIGGANNQEICPVCGSHNAYVALGIFDVALSAASLVAGPEASQDLLDALRRYSAEVKSSGPTETIHAAELEKAITAGVAAALEKNGKKFSIGKIITIASGLCAIWLAIPPEALISIRDLTLMMMSFLLNNLES